MNGIVGIMIGAGLVAFGMGLGKPQGPGPGPNTATGPASRPEAVAYDWSRTDRYAPPDFARHFPDDPEGGLALDRLWAEREARAPEDRGADPGDLPTVRRGLRRTTVDRGKVLEWVGQRFVWGASPQDPDAIEILYHATDPRGPMARTFGDSPSLYFGLMRVEPKTRAILRAVVDWCMQTENGMDWEWAGVMGRSHRVEMITHLEPYLNAADEATRERASVVGKFLNEAPDRYEANLARKRTLVRARAGHLLPGLEKRLREGGSRQRLDALELLGQEQLTLILGASTAEAFEACEGDPDPRVRRALARALGECRLYETEPWGGRLVGVLLRLAEDESPEVRYDAMYHGLTPLPRARREEVVRALLDLAARDRRLDLLRRVAWALRDEDDLAARLLDEDIDGPDPARAEAARAIFRDLTGRTPPGAVPDGPEVREGYVDAFRDLYDHLGRAYPSFGLKGIDWAGVGRELLPRVEGVETEEQFGRLVQELVARLEDSHAAVIEGSATPPAPELPEWDPGIACLTDDRGRPVVYTVGRATEAWARGVRPGMTVQSVNGVPADEAIERRMERRRRSVGVSSDRALRYEAVRWFHRQPVRGAKVALELEGVDGRRTTVELSADSRRWYIPRLPVPIAGIEDGGPDVQWSLRDDGIGYLHVRRIGQGLEVALDQSLRAMGEIRGLILDVRGNSGGGFDSGSAFRNFDLRPDGPAGSGRPVHRGPIALLIDERCISAGEGWASWFVANRRARLFGTTTAGASARKELFTLKNGLYRVVVPVKAYVGFLDRPIERRGLEPDVEVRCTAADLARGRDTVLEAGVEWLDRSGGD